MGSGRSLVDIAWNEVFVAMSGKLIGLLFGIVRGAAVSLYRALARDKHFLLFLFGCLALLTTQLSVAAESSRVGVMGDDEGCSSEQLVVFVLDVSGSMQQLEPVSGKTRWRIVAEDFQKCVEQLPSEGSTKVTLLLFAGDAWAIPLDKLGGADSQFGGSASKFRSFIDPFDIGTNLEVARANPALAPQILTTATKLSLSKFAGELVGIDSPGCNGTRIYDAVGIALGVVDRWAAKAPADQAEALVLVHSDGENESGTRWFFPKRAVQNGMRFREARVGGDDLRSAQRKGDLQDELDKVRRHGVRVVISTAVVGEIAKGEGMKSGPRDEVIPLDRTINAQIGEVRFSSSAISERKASVRVDVIGDAMRDLDLDDAGVAELELQLRACVFDPMSRSNGDAVFLKWNSLGDVPPGVTIDVLPERIPLASGTRTHSVKLRVRGFAKGKSPDGLTLVGELDLELPKQTAEGDHKTERITLTMRKPKASAMLVERESAKPTTRIAILKGETIQLTAPAVKASKSGQPVTPTLQWSENGRQSKSAQSATYSLDIPSAKDRPTEITVTYALDGFDELVHTWQIDVIDLAFEPGWNGLDPFVGTELELIAKATGSRVADAAWVWSDAAGLALSESRIRLQGAETKLGLHARVGGQLLPYDNGKHAARIATVVAKDRPSLEITEVIPADTVIVGRKMTSRATVRGDLALVGGVEWELHGVDTNAVHVLGTGTLKGTQAENVGVMTKVGVFRLVAKVLDKSGAPLNSASSAEFHVRASERVLREQPPRGDQVDIASGTQRQFEVELSGDLELGDKVQFEVLDTAGKSLGSPTMPILSPGIDGTQIARFPLAAGNISAPSKRVVRAIAVDSKGNPCTAATGAAIVVEWPSVTLLPNKVQLTIGGPERPQLDDPVVYQLVGLPEDIAVEWKVQQGEATPAAATARTFNVRFVKHGGHRVVQAMLSRAGKPLPADEQPALFAIDAGLDAREPTFEVTDSDGEPNDGHLEEGGLVTIMVSVGGRHVTAGEVRVSGPDGMELTPTTKSSVSYTYQIPTQPAPASYIIECTVTTVSRQASAPSSSDWIPVAVVTNDSVSYTIDHAEVKQGMSSRFEVLRKGDALQEEIQSTIWSVEYIGAEGKTLVFRETKARAASYEREFQVDGRYAISAQLIDAAGNATDVPAQEFDVVSRGAAIEVGESIAGSPTELRIRAVDGFVPTAKDVRWAFTDEAGETIELSNPGEELNQHDISRVFPEEASYNAKATLIYELGDPAIGMVIVERPLGARPVHPQRPKNWMPLLFVGVLGLLALLVLKRLCNFTQTLRKTCVQWSALGKDAETSTAVEESQASWDYEGGNRAIWLGYPFATGGWALHGFFSKKALIPIGSLWKASGEALNTRNAKFRPPAWFAVDDGELGSVEIHCRSSGGQGYIEFGLDQVRSATLNKREGRDVAHVGSSNNVHSTSIRLTKQGSEGVVLLRVCREEPIPNPFPQGTPFLHKVGWICLRDGSFWTIFCFWISSLIVLWSFA